MNRIVLGQTGQVLEHIPLGVPSTATFVLEDLTYPESQTAQRVWAEGEADVDELDLTTSAAAGPDQADGCRISVTATSGAEIGQPALLVAPDGQSELIRIAGLTLNSHVAAASPIAGSYPSGSKLYGVRLRADVPDARAADEDDFRRRHTLRITWQYTLGGRVHRKPEIVAWTRHTAAGDELAGEALLWVTTLYPEAKTRLPDGGRFDAMVALLVEEVARDIRKRREEPERFLVGQHGRALLGARILAHLSDHGWSPGEHDTTTWKRDAWARYHAELADLLTGEPGENTAVTTRDTDQSPGTPDRTSRSIFNRI